MPDRSSATAELELVLRAISDPNRRRMIEVLSDGPAAVSEIHRDFEMTQPAVSQHLKVLGEAGLVESRPQGRRRIYHLRAEALVGVYDWVTRYEHFWDRRFERLGALLDGRDA